MLSELGTGLFESCPVSQTALVRVVAGPEVADGTLQGRFRFPGPTAQERNDRQEQEECEGAEVPSEEALAMRFPTRPTAAVTVRELAVRPMGPYREKCWTSSTVSSPCGRRRVLDCSS